MGFNSGLKRLKIRQAGVPRPPLPRTPYQHRRTDCSVINKGRNISLLRYVDGRVFSVSPEIFFKEIYYTENSVRYTRLQNCSFNQFAIVVIHRARDRVSTVLGMYKCSSEKQVQREKHCGSWVNG
jgi:hypothetical protein